MRTLTASILTILFAAPLLAQDGGVALTVDDVTPERVLAGSATFNNGSCVICHAVGGHGSGIRGPNLSDIEWLHSEGDPEGIRQTIDSGVPQDRIKAVTPRPFGMNPRGNLTLDDEQMAALVSYVWALSRPDDYPFIAAQQSFLDDARDGDSSAALATFASATSRYGQELIEQRGLNALGYEIMGAGDIDAAIAIFELNTERHPEAANPWDSLAEAFMNKGENEKAIEYYRKSLELDPENTNATEKLRELGAE